MCAIAGLVNWGDERSLERMTKVQAHRGPDDAGAWSRRTADGTWLALGSRRLSILDLSPAGHMPMSLAEEKLWIVHNGEIYNSPELRSELESQGCRFRSQTDTEVLLRLYEREGPACVRRLNGIFSFAVADLRREPTLFLARDHFGVKPLYYAEKDGRFAFASEAKALFELPVFPRDVDPRALHQYLTFLWVPEPGTMWKEIRKLPAGHYGMFQNGRWKTQRYWDLEFPPAGHAYPLRAEELCSQVRERFRGAVRGQMLSDVPVGAFLSAGIDSSAVVAAMARSSPRPVRTYTITFAAKYRRGETNLDDPAVAARSARRFGAEHTEIVAEPAVAELLPKLAWHMDDPVADPAIVMAYLVCREARASSTVLLSGLGGDEVFGGYRKYRAALAGRYYRLLPAPLRMGVLDPLLRRIPALSGTAFKDRARLLRKWGRVASLPPQEQFIQSGVYLDGADLARLAPAGLPGDPAADHRQAFARAAGADWLNQMLYVDSKVFLPSLNLNYNDKMGMAASVEVRVPFLDPELAQWAAWNVPPSLKIRGGETKHILRSALAEDLPAEVLRQNKASFGAPVGYWLEHELKEMTDDLLSESSLKARGWLEPGAVRRMIAEHRERRRDWGMQLWQFLTLELWARQFRAD